MESVGKIGAESRLLHGELEGGTYGQRVEGITTKDVKAETYSFFLVAPGVLSKPRDYCTLGNVQIDNGLAVVLLIKRPHDILMLSELKSCLLHQPDAFVSLVRTDR